MIDVLENFARVLAQLAPFLLVGFFAAGMIHAFLPPGLLPRLLGRPGLSSTVKAALIGVPLPLCSCGVIPVAVELRRGGASRGATAAFLVATPETGVDSVAASVAVLHPLMVVFRPLAALVTAVTAGIAVERLSSAEDPIPAVAADCCSPEHTGAAGRPADGGKPTGRFLAGMRYGFVDLFREISFYLVPALLVTALITTFIDPQTFAGLVERPWLQMLVLVAVGMPIYVCATAATPIAAALILSGFSPGAALVFLMVGPATNLVTITAAVDTLGKRGAVVYCLAVIVVSLLFGLLLDGLFDWFGIAPAAAAIGFQQTTSTLGWIATGVFLALLAWHVAARLRKVAGR